MAEFELIRHFVNALPHARAPRGPGDDAAVLGRLCVTTDALVEGVHFRRPPFSLEDVGWKALATNLSDLAAMGARPEWWLCALGLPRGFSKADAAALARGMRPLAVKHGLALVGGNVTSSPVLSLTLTLAGSARRPLLRSGAKPGDVIYVAGGLGEAVDLKSKAQRRPVPLVNEGLLAARYARAAIDVSDGLLQDLTHVLEASRVGAELTGGTFPEHTGEDYALLLAVAPARAKAFERAWTSAAPLRRIGTFTARRGLRVDGRPVAPRGFDHLKK
ncbi:MAG: thiamine-phosphate kinase [Archangiaceae bacterium]|nr:thiamine-phosphate kinase [Archangiaceae bacterium]